MNDAPLFNAEATAAIRNAAVHGSDAAFSRPLLPKSSSTRRHHIEVGMVIAATVFGALTPVVGFGTMALAGSVIAEHALVGGAVGGGITAIFMRGIDAVFKFIKPAEELLGELPLADLGDATDAIGDLGAESGTIAADAGDLAAPDEGVASAALGIGNGMG